MGTWDIHTENTPGVPKTAPGPPKSTGVYSTQSGKNKKMVPGNMYGINETLTKLTRSFLYIEASKTA
jgi:hypothetical protein